MTFTNGNDLAVAVVKHGYAPSIMISNIRTWRCGLPAAQSLWPWSVAWNRGNSDAPAAWWWWRLAYTWSGQFMACVRCVYVLLVVFAISCLIDSAAGVDWCGDWCGVLADVAASGDCGSCTRVNQAWPARTLFMVERSMKSIFVRYWTRSNSSQLDLRVFLYVVVTARQHSLLCRALY